MAGQKARIDKDSKQYLDKDARPDAEQETAYKTNKELEAKANAGDEPGPVPVNFHGGTKKDRSRRADQTTSGTTGIGDTGTGLDKMESSNPFASILQKKFGLSESENPGVASAPATSDAPSLGMYSVNNTDFRQQKTDVRHVLESIALQAAETFEMLDENSNVPDPIINDLQTTAKAVSKIYEYVNKNTMSDTGDPNDTSSVPKETPQGKPGVNEETEELDEVLDTPEARKKYRFYSDADITHANRAFTGQEIKDAENVKRKRFKGRALLAKKMAREETEELDEVSKATLGRYINKAKDQIDAASWRSGYNAAKPNDPKSGKVIAAKERQLSKRHGGIELAVDKLTREEAEELDEKLIGNQDKIDANKNGKLDAHDFKLLRAKKTMKEAVDLAFAEILRGKLDADN